MKSLMNLMAYGLVAGASMYGGYLLGNANKKKRKTNNITKNSTNK